MNLKSDISTAIVLATNAHDGQKDFNGEPYILHPLRVMLEAHKRGVEGDGLIAAVLHDVVEDTSVSYDTILSMFGGRVASMVAALSRRPEIREGDSVIPEEPYPDFIKRVLKHSRTAIIIKECDILDNMSRLDKVEAVDPAKAERLRRKYDGALDAIHRHGYGPVEG